MVRKSIFDKLNGFDERYAPAYYEDADLCFSIRKLGYKVVYCPFSSVVHFEGATAGTDVQVGFKKYQVLNAPKFKEKWRKELALQCPNKPEEVLPRASNRSQGPRILIIDDWLPLPDRASGTLRLYLTVKQLCKMGYQVTFVFMSMPRPKMNSDMYVEELQALGVEFIWFEFDLWWELRDSPIIKATHKRLVKGLELRKRKYDRIYICFWWVANYFIDYIREEVPDTPVIIDSEDLHYLREQRQAEITKSKELEKTAAATKKKELAVYAKADCVTTVTEEDRAVLLADLKGMPVMVIPNIHDAVDIDVPYEQRKDFLFIGNFNHGPNQDAVLWFAQDIFPSILKKLPESKFYIVGNNPTQKVHDLASEHIVVTGWVPEVKPYLSKCRVSVIPLRFGAGMKGKVGETMSHGLPMVSTTVGTEGMRIVPQEHAFVTDHAQEFARYAVQLYSDKAIWEEMSRKGKDLISSQYSSEMLAKRMEYLLSFDRKGFTSYRAHAFPHPPKVSIIIPVSGQWKYTKECLESIRKDTAISHEIIVIDNASKDSTLRELRRYPEVRLICNENNLGFPAAMNQGMAAAVGEHILLLNNDTVVSLGWLERMVELAESDATIGLVGPVSNKVSGVQIDKEAKYSTPAEMQAYAQKIAEEKKGIVRDFPRIAFLCTLIKRSLFDCLGGLDERFSPGNFEDDDYCLRAQIAGYKSVIAEDVFIHHYGSVSWQADGEERYRKLLQFNGEKFKAKWGGSPEDIWLRGAPVRKRNVKIPIDKDRFVQEFEQTTILAKEKDGEQALMHARRAVAVYHQSQRKNSLVEYPVVLSLAGNLALMNGELDEARQYFEEEIRLTPGSLRASLGLARVFKKAGLAEASRTMYEAALQLDPENEALKSEMETLNVPQEEERAVV
jgi:GT2 family glycosyltransferase/glycosyltransferase involved in cell wall biosynthesis